MRTVYQEHAPGDILRAIKALAAEGTREIEEQLNSLDLVADAEQLGYAQPPYCIAYYQMYCLPPGEGHDYDHLSIFSTSVWFVPMTGPISKRRANMTPMTGRALSKLYLCRSVLVYSADRCTSGENLRTLQMFIRPLIFLVHAHLFTPLEIHNRHKKSTLRVSLKQAKRSNALSS